MSTVRPAEAQPAHSAHGAPRSDDQVPLRALLLEDCEDDALLLLRELKRGGFEVTFERQDTQPGFLSALGQRSWDIVISDYSLGGFDALWAIRAFKAAVLDIPFIIVSGTIGEETAVAALKEGAHDFLLKGNLARLVPAVKRELREARSRAERRMMEEQLVLSDRMASVGLLAAGVAHEINNPLAAVLANLSVMRAQLEALRLQQPDLADLAEAAADASDGAERVRQIVRDVKIFSRAAQDRSGAVDVHRVLDSSVRMAWNDLRHRAKVVRRYDRRIPAVLATEAKLGQVFLNLVVNAAHAMEPGRSGDNELRLTTQHRGGAVIIEISDTGSGMSDEIRSRLFTTFFTTKPPGEGTGLGLVISQRIVRELGGTMEVQSQLGKGTTFTLTLPATRQTPAMRDSRTDLTTLGTDKRLRVLVIDDELMIINAVRRAIGPGHDVTAMFNPREALRRLRSGERFDVILCDLLMPELSGIEVHGALLAEEPEQASRMVFMTGGAFRPDAARFVEDHADRVLEKPFDRATLLATLAQVARPAAQG